MFKLNLPEFKYSLKNADGKVWIFDVIRKKYIVLTPEEWVRQHFVQYLISALSYPRPLIKIEGSLRYNTLSKRSDIVVFDRHGMPWMVIECKSPEIRISDEVLRQASMYNTTHKAKFLTVTNGMAHYCCSIDWSTNKITLLEGLPRFDS